MKVVFLIVLVLIFPFFTNVFAEPIMITISDDMDKIIFDGKWTHLTEWKKSSLNTYNFDNHQIQFRSAHQDNFIYFMIDFVSDVSIDSGKDKAMICLDTKNDKSLIPDENDYCFVSVLEGDALILQGTSNEDKPLKEISKPEGFIAISSPSDENDRYSKVPHSSYEYKIPTELVGRSSEYGFFLALYEKSSDEIFFWPEQQQLEDPFENPNPQEWGELISPDKSLPEFGWPLLSLIPAFFLIIYLTKNKIPKI